MRFSLVALGLLLSLAGQRAEARKFDFKSEVLATYFRGSYGPSLVGDGSYARSGGTGTEFDKKPASNVSGEIGFLLASTRANLRLGVEFMGPRDMIGVVGSKSDGTQLFTLNSKLSAVMPVASLELLPYVGPTSKMLIGVGAGFALVTLQNAYTFSSAGTALFGNDVTEKASTQAPVSQIYVGYETLFTDTVTAVFDLGYRYIPVRALQSSQDQVTPSGTYTTGADLKNNDGSLRSLNLGGLYAGMAFRFYIGL